MNAGQLRYRLLDFADDTDAAVAVQQIAPEIVAGDAAEVARLKAEVERVTTLLDEMDKAVRG